MATCKSCLADIIWIKTPNGKSIPCNSTPIYYIRRPRSGTKKIITPNGEVIMCEYTTDPCKATGTGYVPHWATCPYADLHRKTKKVK